MRALKPSVLETLHGYYSSGEDIAAPRKAAESNRIFFAFLD